MMMYLVITVVIIKHYYMYLLMQKSMAYMALYHSPLRKDLQDLQEIHHLISNL